MYKLHKKYIKNGGWHFSFLMNAEQIKSKLAAYAHAEYNNENFNSLEKINYSINNKIDLFDRSINFEKIFFHHHVKPKVRPHHYWYLFVLCTVESSILGLKI